MPQFRTGLATFFVGPLDAESHVVVHHVAVVEDDVKAAARPVAAVQFADQRPDFVDRGLVTFAHLGFLGSIQYRVDLILPREPLLFARWPSIQPVMSRPGAAWSIPIQYLEGLQTGRWNTVA